MNTIYSNICISSSLTYNFDERKQENSVILPMWTRFHPLCAKNEAQLISSSYPLAFNR